MQGFCDAIGSCLPSECDTVPISSPWLDLLRREALASNATVRIILKTLESYLLELGAANLSSE